MPQHEEPWHPPVFLHAAGRHAVDSCEYYCEAASRHLLCRRVLMQRTLSGTGTVFDGERKLAVPADHLFLIERPGRYGYCYEGDGAPWSLEYVSIRCGSDVPLIPPECSESPVLSMAAHPGIGESVTELVDAFYAGIDPLIASEKAYRLLLSAFRIMQGARSTNPCVGEVRRILERDFATNLSLARLAHQLGITQETMIRTFKRSQGVSPGQYLLRVRIRHARRLLEQTRDPLKRVAADCGFKDANYFGRMFRREMGCTPARYRMNPLLE